MALKKDNVFLVEIGLKDNLSDAFGRDVMHSAHELGIPGIRSVRVTEVYRLTGDVTRDLARRIAEGLLFDPVSQRMKVRDRVPGVQGKTTIVVWYKKGVTDPVALTAQKGIRDLGIRKDISVSCGKKYECGGVLKKQDAETLARTVLANTLIQDFSILTSRSAK